MIDPRTPEDRVLSENSGAVDWRNAYLGPSPGGGLVAWPESAAQSVNAQLIPELGLGIVLSPIEPLRDAPAHTASLVSELWMGEFVRRIAEEDGWWLVSGEDEYVGWMRAWASRPCSTAEREEWIRRRGAVFAPSAGWLLDEQGSAHSPLMGGSPLLDLRGEGQVVELELVDGTRGCLASESIERDGVPADCARLVDSARQLVGASYRWGGRSPWGIDCSGLVQWAALRAGFQLPRDAIQQSRVGQEISFDPQSWRRGDLLFFHEPVDHVGIFSGANTLLHARARVREQMLGELSELMDGLVGVRRLGPGQIIQNESLWRRSQGGAPN